MNRKCDFTNVSNRSQTYDRFCVFLVLKKSQMVENAHQTVTERSWNLHPNGNFTLNALERIAENVIATI